MLLSLFCLEPGLPQVFTVGAELCQVGSGKWGIPQVAGGFLPQGGGKMGLGPSERLKTGRDLGREWSGVDCPGVVVEEVFSVHGVPLPRSGRASGFVLVSHSKVGPHLLIIPALSPSGE